MNTILKWLLKVQHGELIITEKQVSKFAPVNRVLEGAGWYEIDTINVKGTDYMYVYEPSERNTKKSKILVSKISDESIVDLDKSDKKNMEEIAIRLLDFKDNIIN
ncbi:MAG: hypothetical protein WC907_01955 [Acholeplasmataceae bacterium]